MVGHRRQEANKTKPRPTSPLGASRSARIRHSRGPSRRLSPEASCSRRCVRLPTFMYFSDAPLLACASGLSRRLCRLGIFRAGLARQPGSPGSIIAGTGRPDLSWATGSQKPLAGTRQRWRCMPFHCQPSRLSERALLRGMPLTPLSSEQKVQLRRTHLCLVRGHDLQRRGIKRLVGA